jgi:hypothetical protein
MAAVAAVDELVLPIQIKRLKTIEKKTRIFKEQLIGSV